MPATPTKFPKTIYAAWDGDGKESYLVADKDWQGHAVQNDTRQVAVYELKEVCTIVDKPELVRK
jgi:hypothetical protein